MPLESPLLLGATVEAPKGPTKSALHWAAYHGQDAGVELVLSRDGEMVTSQDDAGNTPQHLASAGGHVGIVTKLLDAGGDVSATNKQGDTLLHSASAGGHSELVRMLIQRAPELLSKGNAKGQSPLFSAALAPDAAGKGKDALKKACKAAVAVSKLLLDHEAALLKQADSEGKTVLHVVAHSGKCEDLVDLFVDRGGPELIQAKDAAGNDCLAEAPPNVKEILTEALERFAEATGADGVQVSMDA